jgi:nucleoside-diphosphate-sugar epimerase
MRIAVAGTRGFVGSAVTARLDDAAVSVRPINGLRMDAVSSVDADVVAAAWTGRPWRRLAVFPDLVEAVRGCDVVVVCAGLARPGSADRVRLFAANALAPAALADAAAEAGCTRLVHVSSAAVQGATRLLDEGPAAPDTPYALSKALGERLLLDPSAPLRGHTVVYRATSVQGAGRATTESLVRWVRRGVVPAVRGIDPPLPLSLVENTAAAVVHLAGSALAGVVLHPWEGITVGRLHELVGTPARWRISPGQARRLLATARRVDRGRRREASVRRLELLLLGQEQGSSSLTEDGFLPPVGEAGWRELLAP